MNAHFANEPYREPINLPQIVVEVKKTTPQKHSHMMEVNISPQQYLQLPIMQNLNSVYRIPPSHTVFPGTQYSPFLSGIFTLPRFKFLSLDDE